WRSLPLRRTVWAGSRSAQESSHEFIRLISFQTDSCCLHSHIAAHGTRCASWCTEVSFPGFKDTTRRGRYEKACSDPSHPERGFALRSRKRSKRVCDGCPDWQSDRLGDQRWSATHANAGRLRA